MTLDLFLAFLSGALVDVGWLVTLGDVLQAGLDAWVCLCGTVPHPTHHPMPCREKRNRSWRASPWLGWKREPT